ncbi:MAG: mannose-6-phosphate isomerase, class I [Succinivibrio sp.]
MISISGNLKHYAWGGYSYLPMILGLKPDGQPCSELWFGDHPAGSSTLVDGSPLSDWVARDPSMRLGKSSVARFGPRLPYLLKILDVRAPLSIQVHPNLEQARAGYSREKDQGVPDALRSYKDDNHKPELMLALSDFFMLHGFAGAKEAQSRLDRFESLRDLSTLYRERGLKPFVEAIFSMDKASFPKLFDPIVENSMGRYKSGAISKLDPLFWFCRAVEANRENSLPYDAGLLMILIMNLMYVPAGSAVFQGAGVPHAYLEGLNIELMANSDNVVRGGLTPKHVDVKELLAITRFESESPSTLKPSKIQGGVEYEVPVPDFRLREYRLNCGERIAAPAEDNACIWLLFSGEAKLGGEDGYHRGISAFFQRPGEICEIAATTQARIFRASCAKEG